MRRISSALFILIIIIGFSPSASALHLKPDSFFPNSESGYVVKTAANGWRNVTAVFYPKGKIVKTGNKRWHEIGNNGARFKFREVGRDRSSIYLRDNSRGVNLRLNLSRQQIFYSDDKGRKFPLARITRINGGQQVKNKPLKVLKKIVKQIGNPGQRTTFRTVRYNCNEGIPLILRFEQTGIRSWVKWTHDGFTGKRLPQVRSGSGSKYSSGRYTVHTKGNRAFVNLAGIKDNCVIIGSRPAVVFTPRNPIPSRVHNNGLAWIYSQFNDASNKGRTTSNLIFGIPETDATQIYARCNAGSSGNFSLISFGANVNRLKDGQSINVSLSTGSFNRLMRGEVTKSRAEEGLSGVRLTIDNDDPVWSALRRGITLKYTINGRVHRASLRGSSNPIRRFVDDCRYYASNYTPEKPNQTPPQVPPQKAGKSDPRWASCTAPENKQSLKSDTPLTVTFINKSGEHRGVRWRDFNGKSIEYAALNDGEKFTIKTFLTHPWEFTDGPGNCIEVFQPVLGVEEFNITAPSPGFGNE